MRPVMPPVREKLRRLRQHQARGWQLLTSDWRHLVEKPLPAADLSAVMERVSLPTFSFCFMLALATAIATLGLLANSAAAIIGAMIIAPLMAPIVSLAFGMVVMDWRLICRSVVAVAAGTILVIGFAFVSTELIGLNVIGSEILGRTAPTLLDLGVAMAAGCAAAFANTRRSIISSIAGVAIAVALVPPLAVVGIGMAFGRHGVTTGLSMTEMGDFSGEHDLSTGALFLFLTNLAGIVVCASVVFAVNGYGSWKKAAIGLLAAAAASTVLIQPLTLSLHQLYVKSATLQLLATLPDKYPGVFSGRGRVDVVGVSYKADTLQVNLELTVPGDLLPDIEGRIALVHQYLTESLGEPVQLKVEMTLVELMEFEFGPEALEARQTTQGRPIALEEQ